MSKFTTFKIILIGLVIASCGDKKQEKEKVIENTTPHVQIQKIGELKIAYYDQDSMKLNFEYYKQQDKIVEKKQLAFNAIIEKKRAEGQAYLEAYSTKAQNNELSPDQMRAYEENLQKMEAEIMQYQQTEGAKLEQETMKKLEVIGNKIESFSKKYCLEHGIDILLIYAKGGQFNYINPSMNVTKEFTAYLNQNENQIKKELGKK